MLHFTRVLVELELRKENENLILYERSGHCASVSIGYKQHPAFCPLCENLGHSTSDCNRGQPKQTNTKAKDKSQNVDNNGHNKPTKNTGTSNTNSGPSNFKPNFVMNPIKPRPHKGKTYFEWTQKGGQTTATSQPTNTPPATNALIIYSAPAISTGNFFSVLDSELPVGLDNDDV